MGKPTGFLEYDRKDTSYQPVEKRIRHFSEFLQPLTDDELSRQGARCMDCGIPFCHQGCPVNNIIPDWNDLVYRKDWRKALEVLHSTNNFPEFTGRICPAPCEEACTLNIDDNPVAIKSIECAIADRGWDEGWITPQPPAHKTGKRVAIVGSGPAGLACAQQLARAGHEVTVFEKADRIGGLMRYGIPDFKMEKRGIDRRIAQMEAEGVIFRAGVHVGTTCPRSSCSTSLTPSSCRRLGTAARSRGAGARSRGRPLRDGVSAPAEPPRRRRRRAAGGLDPAEGKHVVVVGGGDTGSDCIGTSIRQGAKSVTQLEILPKPPEKPDKGLTWPYWPNRLRTSSSQAEGVAREWSVLTKELIGENGRVKALKAVRVQWEQDANGRWQMKERPEDTVELKADLVLLAMGFVHPFREGMLEELGVGLDGRGNVAADTDRYHTSLPKVFAAGDMRRGQSLVVWAIREGRQAARAVDEFLMGKTDLPR
jgi:glutamate synthase (NADPH) small chain